MPELEIDGKTHQVPHGQRLVLAIESQGIHIGHRCGGYARCTTCRVEISRGEPGTMTPTEHAKLQEEGLLGRYRLSCQIVCEHDMAVHPVMTLESEGWTDTGPIPEPTVTPEAVWIVRSELEKSSPSG
jgi:ferredoxin